MDRKTLTELDFYRIKEIIAGYCVSQEGKENILNREPFTNFSDFNNLKQLSKEWSQCLSSTRAISISSWPQIQPLFSVLKTQGSTLDLDELYALGLFCLSQKKITDSIKSNSLELNLKHLTKIITQMPDLCDASDIIFSIISPDGELKELP